MTINSISVTFNWSNPPSWFRNFHNKSVNSKKAFFCKYFIIWIFVNSLKYNKLPNHDTNQVFFYFWLALMHCCGRIITKRSVYLKNYMAIGYPRRILLRESMLDPWIEVIPVGYEHRTMEEECINPLICIRCRLIDPEIQTILCNRWSFRNFISSPI